MLGCHDFLGARGGIPENAHHEELVLQQQHTEAHVEGKFLTILSASRQGKGDIDRSPWGHQRVRPLRERSRAKPLRQQHRQGLPV